MAVRSRNRGSTESPVPFPRDQLSAPPSWDGARPSPRVTATTFRVAGGSSLNGSGFNDTGLGLVEPGSNSPRCPSMFSARSRPPAFLRTVVPVGHAQRAVAREVLQPAPRAASHHAAQSPRMRHQRRSLPGDAQDLSPTASWDSVRWHSPRPATVVPTVADAAERQIESGGSNGRHGRVRRSSDLGRRHSPRPAVTTENGGRRGRPRADAPQVSTATLPHVMNPTDVTSHVAASPETSWTSSLASTTASTHYSRDCSPEVLASDDVEAGVRLPSSEGQHGHPSQSSRHGAQSMVHPTSFSSAATFEMPPRLPPVGNSMFDSGAGTVQHRRSDSSRRTIRGKFAAVKTMELDSVAASVDGGSSCSGHTGANVSRMPAGSKEVKTLEEGQKIYDLYSWHEVLQEVGNGGKVVVCRPKQTEFPADKEYVMKIRSRAELRENRLEEQFHRVQERLLCFPPHPGIVRLHEVLLDDAFYYVVMERAGNEPLFRSLVEDHGDGCMPAPSVRHLVGCILEAVRHVHKQGMLHRDIKPDNIVMRSANSSQAYASVTRKRPVLIDFDHADPAWSPKSQQAGDVFGTLRFNAPEALLGHFLPQSDLYSVGAILYLLMTGRFPYSEDVYREGGAGDKWTLNCRMAVHTAMREASIDFQGPPWLDQPCCRDFCSRLLAFNAPDRPISAEHALCHDWFQEREDSES
mmetsp:Transcript_88840/g.176651  ORF Transcript_88840/g.176651 Transcript_88840/m.176651 type:complete len:692 (-) Transcript_88840:121-2196(-)